MNWEQFKSNLQILVGAAGGYVVARGWVSESVATALGGMVMFLGPAIWGWIDNRKQALVAKVNAMPEVAGVVTMRTPEGVALASAVPALTVAPAGSTEAHAVANDGIVKKEP